MLIYRKLNYWSGRKDNKTVEQLHEPDLAVLFIQKLVHTVLIKGLVNSGQTGYARRSTASGCKKWTLPTETDKKVEYVL